MKRVYDDRTNDTLFTAEETVDCVRFIQMHWDEGHEDFPFIWIGDVQVQQEEVLPSKA